MPNDNYLSYVRLVLGLYILKILQQESAHGNKLAQEIKQRTQGGYTPNTNALYPLLRIMEERGYVIGEWNSAATRSKRIYTITETGVARIPALEAMMEERLKQVEQKVAILRSDLLGH
ncbi:MAG TPA: PadR family transcriptional regulator [Sporomusaceae bacterium]|jgi:DNA-binding PadR family transcriptional regulator|uniref:PadR family transcriptional regulator n=1 Tax=Anaerospora sp. TaxID=1960278 RepID=UPI000EE7AD45|nr:PadR family transcriptional regulator [Anaerospora sp.]HAK73768.1 PadR family transcriptional regulator [Sporomusaceae bacterium]